MDCTCLRMYTCPYISRPFRETSTLNYQHTTTSYHFTASLASSRKAIHLYHQLQLVQESINIMSWIQRRIRQTTRLLNYTCLAVTILECILLCSRGIATMVPVVTKIAHNVRYQHLKVLRNLGEFKSIRFEQSPTSYRSVLHSEIPYITMTSSIATAGASSAIASLAIKSDFATVARKNGVDETSIGDYELVVKEYIHPPQNSPIRILEVGMGCRQVIASLCMLLAVG